MPNSVGIAKTLPEDRQLQRLSILMLYLHKKIVVEMKTTDNKVSSEVRDYNGLKMVEMSFDIKELLEKDGKDILQ